MYLLRYSDLGMYLTWAYKIVTTDKNLNKYLLHFQWQIFFNTLFPFSYLFLTSGERYYLRYRMPKISKVYTI